jgi:hypothetical protein
MRLLHIHRRWSVYCRRVVPFDADASLDVVSAERSDSDRIHGLFRVCCHFRCQSWNRMSLGVVDLARGGIGAARPPSDTSWRRQLSRMSPRTRPMREFARPPWNVSPTRPSSRTLPRPPGPSTFADPPWSGSPTRPSSQMLPAETMTPGSPRLPSSVLQIARSRRPSPPSPRTARPERFAKPPSSASRTTPSSRMSQ